MNFSGVPELINKTITGVVFKSGAGNPVSQLILVLSDGTWFEFYSPFDYIIPSHGCWPGDLHSAENYGGKGRDVYYEAYKDGDQIVQHDFWGKSPNKESDKK